MNKSDCIFCKIANKEIPADLFLETEEIVAFNDINPQAPVHILVVPKKHYENLNEADEKTLLKLLLVVKEVAAKAGITDGYRTIINTGKKAGQDVPHLHLHVLAGRLFNWPPG
jgi:histidine triad (HIT) family protein